MATATATKLPRLKFMRRPKTDNELWEMVYLLWGFKIPRTKVCADHVAPFTAFADAYFARNPIDIWKASRGFGGKSATLGLLVLTEAALLGAESNVLGGSAAQSQNVKQITDDSWDSIFAPRHLLKSEPTMFRTNLNNGGSIKALMASQKSVRGPHPQRLRLDEIDEMDQAILDASLGQPMPDRGIQDHIVMSSTHQYPDRTMSEMLKQGREKGWGIYEWCYKECSNPIDGWLAESTIERKRLVIPQHMWETEYDLQEPNFEGRAIDVDACNAYFDPSLGVYEGELDDLVISEWPKEEGRYVTAADWAKKKDWTIIATYRTDVNPWRLVCFLRTGRKRWPLMIQDYRDRMEMYGGKGVHDSIGIGDVIDDYLSDIRNVEGVELRGRAREVAFTEYVSAIESYDLKAPRIKYMFDEHRYCTVDDLYGSGHPPDSFIAGAMAWTTRTQSNAFKGGIHSVTREMSPWSMSLD